MSVELIGCFNFLQKRFGRALELIELDETELVLRIGTGVYAIEPVSKRVFEIDDSERYVENDASYRIWSILHDYVRTSHGKLVPRQRIEEYEREERMCLVSPFVM